VEPAPGKLQFILSGTTYEVSERYMKDPPVNPIRILGEPGKDENRPTHATARLLYMWIVCSTYVDQAGGGTTIIISYGMPVAPAVGYRISSVYTGNG
jgi:hypothetical protein